MPSCYAYGQSCWYVTYTTGLSCELWGRNITNPNRDCGPFITIIFFEQGKWFIKLKVGQASYIRPCFELDPLLEHDSGSNLARALSKFFRCCFSFLTLLGHFVFRNLLVRKCLSNFFLCTCSFLYFSKGHIPLRHLVYRVHALPGSMRPLIWDFGQLNNEVEALYTYQIVSRFVSASLGCQYTIKRDIVIYFLQVIS